jgi:putative transcriptional regulator
MVHFLNGQPMSLLWLNRLGPLAAALLLFPAALLHAALPTPDQNPSHTSVAGQLLIATPTMADPRFSQSVILMVRHDHDGALGIIINRLAAERPLATVLRAVGADAEGVTGTIQIFIGGPVQPEVGFVVHSPDYHRPETLDVDDHVAMTSNREILRDIATKHGPRQSLIAFGYAGWGAGQLEGELERRAWYTAPDDPDLVFGIDREKVWDEAVKRRTQDL